MFNNQLELIRIFRVLEEANRENYDFTVNFSFDTKYHWVTINVTAHKKGGSGLTVSRGWDFDPEGGRSESWEFQYEQLTNNLKAQLPDLIITPPR